MSLIRSHFLIAALWLTGVFTLLSTLVSAQVGLTLPSSVALLLLACLPVIVMVGVFRGAPPETIAEVLYVADRNVRRQPVALRGFTASDADRRSRR